MEVLMQYGLFLAQVVTVLLAIVVLMSVAVGLSQKNAKSSDNPVLRVQHLNEQLEDHEEMLQSVLMSKAEYKAHHKEKEAQEKKKAKEEKARLKNKKNDKNQESESSEEAEQKKCIFVIDFDGDMKASAVEDLARGVTAVMTVINPERDEVVVTLESPGGLVHSYGLAAAQLQRLRDANISLTVCVDRVAASGGYMMAAVANKILSAPFAVIGSIGVVAQIPNFNRLIKKNDVDLELHTAGEYKRTLTLFGENTDEARAKFIDELEKTHELFKHHIEAYRPVVDVKQVATGEHWYGSEALKLNLVDCIMTSDAYLTHEAKEAEVFKISFEAKKSITDKISHLVLANVRRAVYAFRMPLNNEAFSHIRAESIDASPINGSMHKAVSPTGSVSMDSVSMIDKARLHSTT